MDNSRPCKSCGGNYGTKEFQHLIDNYYRPMFTMKERILHVVPRRFAAQPPKNLLVELREKAKENDSFRDVFNRRAIGLPTYTPEQRIEYILPHFNRKMKSLLVELRGKGNPDACLCDVFDQDWTEIYDQIYPMRDKPTRPNVPNTYWKSLHQTDFVWDENERRAHADPPRYGPKALGIINAAKTSSFPRATGSLSESNFVENWDRLYQPPGWEDHLSSYCDGLQPPNYRVRRMADMGLFPDPDHRKRCEDKLFHLRADQELLGLKKILPRGVGGFFDLDD